MNMMPELARVYGLAPADVLALRRDEYEAFLEHYEAMNRGASG